MAFSSPAFTIILPVLFSDSHVLQVVLLLCVYCFTELHLKYLMNTESINTEQKLHVPPVLPDLWNSFSLMDKRIIRMEILHPLLDIRGNLVTENEEKAEVLNAAFASVF